MRTHYEHRMRGKMRADTRVSSALLAKHATCTTCIAASALSTYVFATLDICTRCLTLTEINVHFTCRHSDPVNLFDVAARIELTFTVVQ